MHLASLLVRSGNISFHDDACSKKRLIENIATILGANTPEDDATDIFTALFEREHRGSTYLGEGIALPHARIPHLKHNVAAMLTLAEPVDFGSGENVDIIFGLLVPDGDNAEHLEELARLARVFRQEKIRAQIRAAKDADQVFDILLAVDDD